MRRDYVFSLSDQTHHGSEFTVLTSQNLMLKLIFSRVRSGM